MKPDLKNLAKKNKLKLKAKLHKRQRAFAPNQPTGSQSPKEKGLESEGGNESEELDIEKHGDHMEAEPLSSSIELQEEYNEKEKEEKKEQEQEQEKKGKQEKEGRQSNVRDSKGKEEKEDQGKTKSGKGSQKPNGLKRKKDETEEEHPTDKHLPVLKDSMSLLVCFHFSSTDLLAFLLWPQSPQSIYLTLTLILLSLLFQFGFIFSL